jgi:AcrR family transcriptional regulator
MALCCAGNAPTSMDRFAGAAEELLRTKPFEEISVQDIVRAAKRPIGSFYARFGSKEALLPFLYERYHEGLEPLVVARLARVDWEALDFGETVAKVVDFLIARYDERRWLVRALVLFARMRPEALPPDMVERRGRVYDHITAVLLRHRSRIAHSDAEAAIRFGVPRLLGRARSSCSAMRRFAGHAHDAGSAARGIDPHFHGLSGLQGSTMMRATLQRAALSIVILATGANGRLPRLRRLTIEHKTLNRSAASPSKPTPAR